MGEKEDSATTGETESRTPAASDVTTSQPEVGAGDGGTRLPKDRPSGKDDSKAEKIRPKQFGVLTSEEENLLKCCQEGKLEEARAILRTKKGKFKIDCVDDSGTTPLGHAAYKGNLELVELLLAAGADVNNNMQTQGYTPLMFAALAGQAEVVKVLLQHGARTSAVNNIGRTASQLAGFVGQSQIAVMISNFFTIEDLNYFTVPHGLEKEPKLPPELAPALHRFIMQTNLHPVKLLYFLRGNRTLLEEFNAVNRTMEAIVEKEMKSREMNEVMGMKVHYLSSVLKHAKKFSDEGKSLEDAIKLFVRGRNAKGFPEYMETFLRRSIRSFPVHQTPLHSTMVHAIAKANLGGSGGSLSILEQSINGQHLGRKVDFGPCDTCADPEARKKCTGCKMAVYCNEECQRFHWPVHKKECAHLAEQYVAMQQRKAEDEDRERLEKENQPPTADDSKSEDAEQSVVAAEGSQGRSGEVETPTESADETVHLEDVAVEVSDKKPLLG